MIYYKFTHNENELKKIREEKNYDMQTFSEILKIPYESYRKYEYQERNLPIEKAKIICKEYKSTLYALYNLNFQLDYYDDIRSLLTTYESNFTINIDDTYWNYLSYIRKTNTVPSYSGSFKYKKIWSATIDKTIQNSLQRVKNEYYIVPNSLYDILAREKISDLKLAEELNISRKTLSKYLTNNNLPIKHAITIANKFNCSLEKIYGIKETIYFDLREILYPFGNYIVLDTKKLRDNGINLPSPYSLKIGNTHHSINKDFILFRFDDFSPSSNIPDTDIFFPHSR